MNLKHNKKYNYQLEECLKIVEMNKKATKKKKEKRIISKQN